MLNKLAGFGVLIICLFFAIQCSTEQEDGNNVQAARGNNFQAAQTERIPAAPEVLVETTFLKPRTINSYIILSSTIETESMVDVYPKVNGDIIELLVEEGDRVTKNSTLLVLDDRQYKLAEETAEVNFRKTEAEFERVQESYEKNIISEVEFDNAKFAMQQAELQWKQAQLNLSYTRLSAPIDGVVAQRFIRIGDRVQTGTKIFQIIDTSEKIARVYIPENEISKVRTGQIAVVISEFLALREFHGSVKRISPVVDPTSGTFKITVGIIDPGNLLRPGMFVTVRIVTDVHENVIAIPKDAIIYDGGLPFVFKVEDASAHRIPLNVGFSDDQYIESLSGFSEGDEIIIVGQSGLKDRTKVKTVLPNGNQK